MSCDNELANEWARCSGKNASYITIQVAIASAGFFVSPFIKRDNFDMVKLKT